MKLIVHFLLLVPTAIFAQVLISDNFDDYTAGPVSDDLTGETVGDTGYFTQSSSGSGPSTNLADWANVTGSMGLKLSGPDESSSGIFVWPDGLDTAWNERTVGNDIIQVSFDFTLLTESFNNVFEIFIYDSNYNRLLGVYIEAFEKTVHPFIYYNNGAETANFLFESSVGSVSLNNATSFVMSFNKVTGELMFEVGSEPLVSIQGAGEGLDPYQLVFVASSTEGEELNQGVFDNLLVEAIPTVTLGVEDIQENDRESFTFYPNPVQDVLQIQLGDVFESAKTKISITDMNGKLVRIQDYEESLELSQLQKGVYLLTLTDGTNTQTEKLVKQ